MSTAAKALAVLSWRARVPNVVTPEHGPRHHGPRHHGHYPGHYPGVGSYQPVDGGVASSGLRLRAAPGPARTRVETLRQLRYSVDCEKGERTMERTPARRELLSLASFLFFERAAPLFLPLARPVHPVYRAQDNVWHTYRR